MLLHVARCIVLNTRLMLFWIVKHLYKSVMTFFPMPTGLLTFSLPSGCIARVHTFLCLVTLTNAFNALTSLLQSIDGQQSRLRSATTFWD
jgi:hypothetical protein